MTSAMDDYGRRVNAIMWEAARFLPEPSLADARRLIEHGEAPDGLHYIAWE